MSHCLYTVNDAQGIKQGPKGRLEARGSSQADDTKILEQDS
jgi:hypothetical protein